MKLFLVLFIALTIKCTPQAETVFTISKTVLVANDTAKTKFKADTATQNFFTNMMGLPAGYIVISCNVTLASKGEVFKTNYTRGYPSGYSQVKSFLDHAKPKDALSFENIVVLKDGQTMRLKDRSIVVPGYTPPKN